MSYEENLKKLYDDIDRENGIHKYFAHLTSSQALCFNLFYPLCMEKYFNLIDKRCTEATKFAFEHVEDNSFEKCTYLAKKALTRKLGTYSDKPHIEKHPAADAS